MLDSLVEKTLGGVLICRRYVSGYSVGQGQGQGGTLNEGRQLTFNFRLDPSLTQHLTVSTIYLMVVYDDF